MTATCRKAAIIAAMALVIPYGDEQNSAVERILPNGAGAVYEVPDMPWLHPVYGAPLIRGIVLEEESPATNCCVVEPPPDPPGTTVPEPGINPWLALACAMSLIMSKVMGKVFPRL